MFKIDEYDLHLKQTFSSDTVSSVPLWSLTSEELAQIQDNRVRVWQYRGHKHKKNIFEWRGFYTTTITNLFICQNDDISPTLTGHAVVIEIHLKYTGTFLKTNIHFYTCLDLLGCYYLFYFICLDALEGNKNIILVKKIIMSLSPVLWITTSVCNLLSDLLRSDVVSIDFHGWKTAELSNYSFAAGRKQKSNFKSKIHNIWGAR